MIKYWDWKWAQTIIVTKPFGTRELIARVKANLRRSVAGVENTKKSVNVLDFGKLQIDLDKFEARKTG